MKETMGSREGGTGAGAPRSPPEPVRPTSGTNQLGEGFIYSDPAPDMRFLGVRGLACRSATQVGLWPR